MTKLILNEVKSWSNKLHIEYGYNNDGSFPTSPLGAPPPSGDKQFTVVFDRRGNILHGESDIPDVIKKEIDEKGIFSSQYLKRFRDSWDGHKSTLLGYGNS